MVTRGHALDALSGSARGDLRPPTIVIVPEYKEPLPAIVETGITLFTVHVRRGDPDGAGPEAQLAFEAQLHHRLHPGDRGGGGRGADARSARLRRDLQLDPFLHRAQGRGLDLDRRLLPGRDHPGERDPALPRERHPGVREELLADRRLWRRGGVRDRHLRRPGAGARGRRAGAHRRARADGRRGCRGSTRRWSRRTSRERSGPDR